MELSQLTPAQLRAFIHGLVDDRLRELLGDPDLGRPLGDGLRARLSASLSNTTRVSGEDLAQQLGLHW